MGAKMGTVSKALGLIELLRQAGHPAGLTEIARKAQFDKATTRRLLLELAENGYVEQDPESRTYALGPALQVLGRIREERFPLVRIVQPLLRDLAERTGETVHATEYCAGELASIWSEESLKASRVILEKGMKLPLHATASGHAFLAASTDAFVDKICKRNLGRFTGTTPTEAGSLRELVEQARLRGYSQSNQSFEDGVSSVASAIVDGKGKPIGTLAIAMPSSRMNAQIAAEFGNIVRESAAEASARLLGNVNTLRKAS